MIYPNQAWESHSHQIPDPQKATKLCVLFMWVWLEQLGPIGFCQLLPPHLTLYCDYQQHSSLATTYSVGPPSPCSPKTQVRRLPWVILPSRNHLKSNKWLPDVYILLFLNVSAAQQIFWRGQGILRSEAAVLDVAKRGWFEDMICKQTRISASISGSW